MTIRLWGDEPDELLAEFHAAGIYLDGEREELARPLPPPPPRCASPSRVIDRSDVIAHVLGALDRLKAGLAVVVILIGSHAWLYGLGEGAALEGQAKAYETARYATALLNESLGQAEDAVSICLTTDAELHAEIARTPVAQTWPANVLAGREP